MPYPRQGKPLLPRQLNPLLGSVALHPVDARRAGLAPGTRLDELDPEIWTNSTPDQINFLAAFVMSELRLRFLDLLNDDTAIFQIRPLAAELDLSRRSYNALTHAGLLKEGRLRPTTLRELSKIRNFGAVSVLDVLNAVGGEPEDQAGISEVCLGPDQEPPAELGPSHELRAAAERLASEPWAINVHPGDPRLGQRLRAMIPSADSAAEAIAAVAERRDRPGDSALMAQAIDEFISDVNQLGDLRLEEELRDVARTAVSPQHVQTVVARYGLDGSVPMTLEVTGRRANVTRERVRQVTQPLHEAFAGCYAPTLDRALQRVAALAPSPPSAVAETLRIEGLTDQEFCPAALTSAARLLGRQLPFSYSREHDLYTKGGGLPALSRVSSVAGRLVQHWGVTTVEDVAEAANVPIERDDERAALSVLLSQIPAVHWLDAEQRWFWIASKSRNRLLNQIEKILSVAGSIDLGELRDGVGRSHRMKGFRPPRAILSALCKDTHLYTFHEGRVGGGPQLPDWQELLGTIERALVEVLFDEGPVMRREDLERHVVGERGIARNSFNVYLTYSPILRRFAPGVFGLRGAPVTAAQVQATIPPRVRTQVLKDHGWTSEGKLWAVYRVSQSAVSSGVLSPSVTIRDVARGRYELVSEDGRAAGSLVVEDRIWGLSPFYRRWGIEPGDHVALVLHPMKHEATVSAGGDDLLLRFQKGE